MNKFAKELGRCSTEDKQLAIKSLEKIINLSRSAHKHGLLYIENIIDSEESIFLKKAVELLLDGTPPHEFRGILENYIMTTELNAYELLERVIYSEGILLIQEGEYPWDIRKNLASYFGEDFIHTLDSHFVLLDDNHNKLVEHLEKESVSSNVKQLDIELNNIDKRSMQRILRECDLLLLVIAFEGSSKELRNLAIDSLSVGKQNVYLEVVELMGEINESQIIDAQGEIISIVRQLRISKDIV